MRILCLDTSAGAVVAAVGDGVLVRRRSDEPRRHAESLTPLIDSALAEAGWTPATLDAIAVGTGPAPFTGLRVGLVTARTLARALDVPVYGVCSLDVHARGVLDRLTDRAESPADDAVAEVLVASDARRREVHWAVYRGLGADDVETLDGPHVGSPAAAAAEIARRPGLVVAGPGAELYPDVFPAHPGVAGDLDAAVLARIVLARLARRQGGVGQSDPGQHVDLGIEPQYLRRPDVTMSAGRKRVS